MLGKDNNTISTFTTHISDRQIDRMLAVFSRIDRQKDRQKVRYIRIDRQKDRQKVRYKGQIDRQIDRFLDT